MALHDNLHPFSSLDWDLHSFELLNTDIPFVMQAAPFLSSDSSTGYLQDAIIEWTDRCKRRRELVVARDQTVERSDGPMQDCWNLDYKQDLFENFASLSQETDVNTISDDPLNSLISSISSKEATSAREMKKREEAVSENEDVSPTASSHIESVAKYSDENASITTDRFYSGSHGQQKKKKKKVGMKVAHPFAVVKPGGTEGDVTLNDINERILMRPTRPVRHPVGEFASFPCVMGHGPGLSGKSVVALTRIHTQGRGTITIIRTRG